SQFQEKGLPSTKHEDWGYTNFADISRGDFFTAARVGTSVSAAAEAISNSAFSTANRLVFVNGIFADKLSSYSSKVKFSRLAEILADEKSEQFATVKEALFAFDKEGGSSGYEALNGALLNDGVLLTVDDNTQEKELIEIF